MKSSGDLGVCEVYQAGTGSKQNKMPEKKLIYEAATIFLGSNAGMHPRALKVNVFSVLGSQITRRGELDRKKLAREMHGTTEENANVARRSTQEVYSGFNTLLDVDLALAGDTEGGQDMDDAGLQFG